MIDMGGVNFKDSILSVINMDTTDDDNNHDAISTVYYFKKCSNYTNILFF